MSKIVPIRYMPDADCWWSVNPGAVSDLQQLAPLARGSYGTVGSLRQFTITGTDYVYGKLFRQVSGSTRFLVFRKSDIDEYASNGPRTNQGTGYSASTATWSAAGFGNAIVACNYLNDTQISTGTTFSAIGSGCPKARLVAANNNFTMLADYDDSVNQYADGWWCSAIGNATSWTASLATQAANGRILDVSGPIRALVAYKDTFVAFKDNSIHILEYVGPPYIWSVRTVTNAVGAHGPRAVCELRGVLYFVHSSGLYSFDGSNITSIGDVVENTFLALANEVRRKITLSGTAPTGTSLATAQVVADDVENIIWFSLTSYDTSEGTRSYLYSFGYNVTSGKWGSVNGAMTTSTVRQVVVDSTHADRKSFGFTDAAYARVIKLQTLTSTSGVFAYAYPYAATQTYESMGGGNFTTGVIGEHGQSVRAARVWWHTGFANNLSSSMITSVASTSYKNSGNIGGGLFSSGVVNTRLDCGDVNFAGGAFATVQIGTVDNAPCEIYGIGVDLVPAGKV